MCICVYGCMHMCACTLVRAHANADKCMGVCQVHVHVNTCGCVCVCVYVCVRKCVYVCVYLYMHLSMLMVARTCVCVHVMLV